VHRLDRRRVRREQQGALQHVAQLADVARPRVAGEGGDRVRGEAGGAASVAAAQLVEGAVREPRDVRGAALAQRRELEREYGEPVVEVLAEAPGPDGGPQVDVGRGDDPDVDLELARAAEAAEAPRVQHGEQLGLHLGREVADLVEEERAAVGQLEQPALGLLGVGERAALVAEQLGAEEGGRQLGAVDGDEGLPGARRQRVQPPREPALARARLAGEQHRRRAGREEPEALAEAVHRRRRAEGGEVGSVRARAGVASVATRTRSTDFSRARSTTIRGGRSRSAS
jgi:hypothetical protein